MRRTISALMRTLGHHAAGPALAVLLLLTAWVPQAAAVPITFDVALTPSSVGPGSPFGVSSLPAGPFTGFFALDSSKLAAGLPFDFSDRKADVLDFSLTLGNTTFALADLTQFRYSVSSGTI